MKLSLKKKIFILVSLPSVSLMILIFMLITKSYKDYKDATNAVSYSNFSTASSKLLQELQKERGKSSVYLGGKTTKEDMLAQRALSLKADEVFTAAIPQTEITEKINNFINQSQKDFKEAREIVDNKGIASEAIKLFSKGIQQLILCEIFIAQNTNAFGDEKKLLSVTMLDIGKENAGKLRAVISNVLNVNKELTLQQIQTITNLMAGISENINSPTLIINDNTKDALAKFKERPEWIQSMAIINGVLEKANKGDYGYNSKEYFDTITVAINSLGEIIFKEQEAVGHSVANTKKEITTKLGLVLLINTVLIFLVFGLSIYFIKSITLPIQNMIEKLTGSSGEVNQTSEELSRSAEILSTSSVEQASALQETVSSVEEITQMIAKTAENAKVSKNVSIYSIETAQNGQMIVTELNHSINEIAQANDLIKDSVEKSNLELEEISRIISEIGIKTRVINDIVFQTKLLSFNASVEAARAGEQGKGFAVVAEEVGNLAQMSGKAAKEISDVLDQSLQLVNNTIQNSKRDIGHNINFGKNKVEIGLLTARKCGESLTQIVEKTQEVNQLVIEIATACTEQSLGMGQISAVMNGFDKTTHSNAVTASEATELGYVLKQQSNGLKQAVDDLSTIIYG